MLIDPPSRASVEKRIAYRRLALCGVVLAAIAGVAGVSLFAIRRTALAKAKQHEWREMIHARSIVKNWVVTHALDRIQAFTAEDVDAILADLRDYRRVESSSRFVWLCDTSPRAWSEAFASGARCVIASVDRASGEIVYLGGVSRTVVVDGESPEVIYLAAPDVMLISPEGARRLTQGWVRIEP